MNATDVSNAVQVMSMETKKLVLILCIGAAVMVNDECSRVKLTLQQARFARALAKAKLARCKTRTICNHLVSAMKG